MYEIQARSKVTYIKNEKNEEIGKGLHRTPLWGKGKMCIAYCSTNGEMPYIPNT
jgi:hypothetical protein